MRRSLVRSWLVVCELLAAAVLIGLGSLTSPNAATSQRRPFHGKTMLVGIVLPEGCLPGRTCTASFVTEANEFQNSPGIAVRPIRVPDRTGSKGHATLRGLVVASNTAKDQPASGPITFTAPQIGAPLRLDLTVAAAESPEEIVDVPVGELPPDRMSRRARHPTMPPIVPDNGLLVVRDRFTGDSRETRIKVNGVEVPTLAQSQSVLAIAPHDALHQGKNDLEVSNGGRTTYYEAWSPDVTIDADKTTLEQGETTQFRVKVKLGVMPHSYWGTDGKILLTIKNDSESTTTMSGGNTIVVPVQESDIADGSYTYTGTITGNQPGEIQLEASTQSQLEDAPPTRTTENPPTPAATRTPALTERTPGESPTPIPLSELGPPVIYVPETPVLNAPKCCVITSITITNTSNEPVFYILNGSYVSGMSPPPDQWVQPGQSRTYKGDFGECIRIEAIQNRGEDANGNPLTGIFADQTVCCKDILTGKARIKGIAITINSIEWREWKDCPEKTPTVPVAPPPPEIVRTRTKTATPTKTPRRKRTPTPTATSTETPTETSTEFPPTPYTPETPVIYRPSPVPPCCGITGNLITYPITSDPMEVPRDPEAPRDVAAAGYHVLLHNGAFFQNQDDITVDALAFPVEWTRHWHGKLTFKDGGINGDGWDFSYNKRIVPIAPQLLSNGLFAERIGVDKAELTYYNGQDRADVEREVHSEERQVFNFDTRFEARVTTYKALPGSFHEIERYILTPTSPHPFADHVNVEPGERIFYVLREKNGTRYVFNCRGQLIYILSRNDSPTHHVRVELQYLGPLNPLTQNPMLSKLIDTSGHVFDVTTINIHQGTVSTNIKCNLVNGQYPIPRIRSISGAGFTVRYNYRAKDTEPILEAALVDTYDSSQKWEYTYDGANRMTEMKLPNESAKGAAGKPFFVNTYDAQGRVESQNVGGVKRQIKYSGSTVTVTDASGDKQYELASAGLYPVIESVKVIDKNGKSWTTKYEHNGFTQATRLINPLGNGVKYDYETANAEVTLGPIRDWVDHYTYENNLAQGNLLKVTLFALPGDSETITTQQTYEHLYNQTDYLKDALGNTTITTYEYVTPGNRGNPITLQGPPVAQPDSGTVPSSLTTFTYNDFGQRTDTDSGNGHRTHFDYDARHYLHHVDYPGGSNETFENSVRGEVKEKTGSGGTLTYNRNGRGLVELKKIGPDNLHIWTKFEYDLNDNVTDTTLHIEDTFGPNAGKYGLYDLVDTNRVMHTDYDVLNRQTRRTLKADGKSFVTTYDYGPAGQLSAMHSPPFSASGEYLTSDKYDARGLIIEETTADGSNVAMKTCTTYDDNGRPTHVDRVAGKKSCPVYDATAGPGTGATTTTIFDGFDRPISSTDSLGAEHIYKYDAAGNVEHAEVSGPTGRPGEARQLLFSADHKFDAYGHEILKSVEGLDGGGVAKTKYYYDGDLQLRKQRNPYGGETTFDYNVAGHVEDVTDPLGEKVHNVYDLAGNLKHIDETDIEQVFNRGSASYAQKKITYVTDNTYDATGRLTDVTSPAGVQHLFYDSIGEVRAVSSSSEGVTQYRYDGFGRRTEVARADTKYKTDYTPGGLVAESTATADNGLATTSHEKFDYDQIGHTVTRTNVLSGGITEFKYDKLGRQNVVIDPNSTEIHSNLNDAGLPEEVTIKFPTGVGVLVSGRMVSAVGGPSVMTYNWDGLGRVVSGTTNQGSEVDFKYDGLGRVLEETQSYGVRRQTVKHEYDSNGKWADTIYPDMAGGGRVRSQFDTLERTTEVDFNGTAIASYLYTGPERIAQQTDGNGTKTRFEYDNHRRLVREEVAAVGIRAVGDTLWSETATYNEALLKTVQEVSQPTDVDAGRVLSTTLTYDNLGRIVSSTTSRASMTPGTSAMVQSSGSFSEFQGGRLKKMAEFLRDDVNDVTPLERCDTFDYTPDGQVESLSSIGRLKGKSPTSPASLDDVENHITADPTVSSKQGYFYDHKGNLTYDGRFVYTYDYNDHLLSVEDTWAPFRYNEAVSFVYDAFGRRIRLNPSRDRVPHGLVRWGGAWDKSSQWFVYDGARVIAEIVPKPLQQAPDNTLLARYFFGARADQRIRMDRRPENDLSSRLETFYFHDDLQGNIKFISNDRGEATFAANREPTPGTEDAAPERPPGDENYIQGTEIRMPYLADATRLDGFAGTVSREDAQKPIYNYRSAFQFSKQLDQSVLHDSITAQQNRLLAVFAAMAAAPVVLPAAAAGAAAAGAPSLIVAGMTGGLLNSGMNFYAASHTQSDYSSGDMLKDFGGGALMGVSGGVVQGFGYGALATHLIDFGVNTASGTLWDVGTTGRGWGDALSENALASAQMAVIGAGIGVVNKGLRGAFGVAGESIEASGTSRRSAPGVNVEAPQSSVATAATRPEIEIYIDDQVPDHEMLTLPLSAEAETFDAGLMYELQNGTTHSAEIARRLALPLSDPEALRVKFEDLENECGGCAGKFEPTTRTIHINTNEIENIAEGRWRTRQVASTIVHEGIHAMGGGELAAHIGEAQFLISRSARLRWKMFAYEDVTRSDIPYLQEGYEDLINTYREGTMAGWYSYFARFPSYRNSPHLRRIKVFDVLDLSTNTKVREYLPIDPFLRDTPFPPAGRIGENLNERLYDVH